MHAVGVIAGLALGAALVAAGILKLSAGPQWQTQAADLGVPTGVARIVPFVEIALGAGLAAQLWQPWPAIAAAGLLVLFTLVIAARIRDGSRPPCACFGPRSTRPLGAYHLLRNVVLITLAVVAAVVT